MEFLKDEKESDFELETDTEASFEDVDETEGNFRTRIKELKDELKKCATERKEYLDGWQRAKADYLNSQKRFDEERSDLKKRAEIHFIEKILPLADSFSMALDGLVRDESGGENAWRSGLLQIHTQLTSVLKELGVSEISDLGKHFDPHRHDALGNQEVADAEKHDTIVAVLQRGYLYKDMVIRPAKVIIGITK